MTCIVGIAQDGDVFIGGDSAGVDTGSYALTVRADVKVFRNGPFIMGFTSSFRMGQLLHHAFKPPKRYADQSVEQFMVTDFIDAARSCLKDGGFAEKHNEGERGGVFLVGYDGRLFEVHEDYQVGESVHGFSACGCGESFALGVLAATRDVPPVERIQVALAAAETFSAGVRGPFHIERLTVAKAEVDTA